MALQTTYSVLTRLIGENIHLLLGLIGTCLLKQQPFERFIPTLRDVFFLPPEFLIL
jgi:hypothetical protein